MISVWWAYVGTLFFGACMFFAGFCRGCRHADSQWAGWMERIQGDARKYYEINK